MTHEEALRAAAAVAQPTGFHTGGEIASRVVRAYLEARAETTAEQRDQVAWRVNRRLTIAELLANFKAEV